VLDTESQALMAWLGQQGRPPLGASTPEQARAASAATAARAHSSAAMHSVVEERVPTPDGDVRVRILRPAAEVTAVVVYLHGGGWVLGSIDGYEPLARELAASTRATVVLVDYRKAPEAPYPAAVDDAWAALLFADRLRSEIDPPLPLTVGGDSAGGNLAIALALRARDLGEPHLDATFLAYPVVDVDTTRPSYTDPRCQQLLTGDAMRWFLDQYAPGDLRDLAEVSPLRQVEWRDFPPTALITAELDPLRDEGVELVERLTAAGVPVLAHHFTDQMHGFLPLTGLLAASSAAVTFLASSLNVLIIPTKEPTP
jgi:acetyl esterase